MPSKVRWMDPNDEMDVHRKNLPHWQQDGSTLFVTWRLADSIPQARLAVWRQERAAWLTQHAQPWASEIEMEYHARFSGRMESWLDQGLGSCVLRKPENAEFVADILRKFDSIRYTLHAWVVMPNHVHVLFSLLQSHKLEEVIKSWKGVSARRINESLSRSGTLWMPDYFDRLIRDGSHFWNCARYVRRNPIKAKLGSAGFILYETPILQEHLDAAGI